MIGRAATFLSIARGAKLNVVYDSKEMRFLAEKAKFLKFRYIPWNLWICSIFVLIVAIAFSYYIIFLLEIKDRSYIQLALNLIFYYTAFFIFYVGKVQTTFCNKETGTIISIETNVFLSKEEKTYQISELKDIEIVLKGVKRGNSDTSKYYIRLSFNNAKYEFGQTYSFESISLKYQRSLAFFKGIIIPEIDMKHVKDEVKIDQNFVY